VCGRYRLSATEQVAQFFEVELTEELRPCYNIAPSQQVPTMRQVGPGRVVAMVHWRPCAFLGEGCFQQQQDDQRPQRDGRPSGTAR
jgi:putative SOS response-associated peptidase YedK